MEEEKLGCFGHFWNFMWLIYLAITIFFAYWALRLSTENPLLKYGALFGVIAGAVATVYQVHKKKPDGIIHTIKHEFFILRKSVTSGATWLNNRNMEITNHQTEELKDHIDKAHLMDNAKLEELSQAIERQPTEIKALLNQAVDDVLAQEHEERSRERRLYEQQLQEMLNHKERSTVKDKIDTLRKEIALAFVRFRDQFARTKENQHVYHLNELRLQILGLAQESEVYLKDDFQDINHEIWSAYLELVIAIDRHESNALAPQKTKEQWFDRIYGERNAELYKQVAECVEAIKLRFQSKANEELSSTDLKALKTLWECLKYEKIHELLQGYIDNNVDGVLLDNYVTYTDYRHLPKYELDDTEIENKLKGFDSAMRDTMTRGRNIFSPTVPSGRYHRWDSSVYILDTFEFTSHKAEFDAFVKQNVTPTLHIYRELINILKRRGIFQLLEWGWED